MFKKLKNMHKIFILLLFLAVSSFKGYGQPISNCPNNAAVYGQFSDPIYCYNGTQDYTLIINPNFLSIACSGNWNYVLYEDQSFNWNTTQTNLPNLSAIVQQSGSISQTSYTFLSLPPGNYVARVTNQFGFCATSNNNGCGNSQKPFKLSNPAELILSTSTPTVLSCFNSTNGQINITVSGSTALPYTVTKDGLNPQVISTNPGNCSFSNLSAGTYSIQASDNNNCSKTNSVTILAPTQISVTGVITTLSCNGQNNAQINITPSGGTPPYTFLWSNNASTEDINGLGPGNYTITLTDSNGCFVDTSIIITQPPQMFLAETHINNDCFNGSNGSINLTATGGTPGYTYLWSNGFTSQDINNLSTGAYSVTVTDANGCETSITNIDITSPTALTVTGVIVSNNIDLSVVGGTLPYNYSWSNGAVTQDLPNVTPGTYIVSVTDAYNCTVSDTFIVNNASIDGNELSEITLLPNPAMDKLTIRGGAGSLAQHSFFVQDCYGRIVAGGSFESDEATVSVEHLAPGLYYLHIGLNSISFVVIH
jgi:uncharacterized protein (DUF2141 family)